MKKIITSGDGFAANHIWPMWPKILQEATNSQVWSLGKPAAGNEYIFNSVLEAITHMDPDLVLIQWTNSNRLDLIVDSNIKRNIALNDEVYYHNLYRVYQNEWWLSNASKQPYVREYHEKYIGRQQSLVRTRNYIVSMAAILKSKNIPYKFFSTYDVEVYQDPAINWSDWIWHQPGRGMEHYSRQDKFSAIRGTEVQPSTEIHRAWVEEIILPNINQYIGAK